MQRSIVKLKLGILSSKLSQIFSVYFLCSTFNYNYVNVNILIIAEITLSLHVESHIIAREISFHV
jgi:hypothetical protein